MAKKERLLNEIRNVNEHMELLRECGKAYMFIHGALQECRFAGIMNKDYITLQTGTDTYVSVLYDDYGKTWSFDSDDIETMRTAEKYHGYIENRQWEMRSGPVKDIDDMSTTHLKNVLSYIDETLSQGYEDEIKEDYYSEIRKIIEDEVMIRTSHTPDKENRDDMESRSADEYREYCPEEHTDDENADDDNEKNEKNESNEKKEENHHTNECPAVRLIVCGFRK